MSNSWAGSHRRWNVPIRARGGHPESVTNRGNCQGSNYLVTVMKTPYIYLFFKIRRISATVFAWQPFFGDPLDLLLYPGFTKSAKSGPHHPRLVSINVRGPKGRSVRAKGHLGDPKDILGLVTPLKTYKQSHVGLKGPQESQKDKKKRRKKREKFFCGVKWSWGDQKRPWQDRKEQRVPKEISKTSGT